MRTMMDSSLHETYLYTVDTRFLYSIIDQLYRYMVQHSTEYNENSTNTLLRFRCSSRGLASFLFSTLTLPPDLYHVQIQSASDQPQVCLSVIMRFCPSDGDGHEASVIIDIEGVVGKRDE